MAGSMEADDAASSPFEGPGSRFAIPRWAVAILVLIAAIVILWAIFVYYGGRRLEAGRPILQAVIQGLVVGSIYVLGASGLSLTYGIKKFANFSHGDMMTVGAYVAFALTDPVEGFGQPLILGVIAAILAVAFLGIFLELAIFRRLERREPVAALIASVGVALV